VTDEDLKLQIALLQKELDARSAELTQVQVERTELQTQVDKLTAELQRLQATRPTFQVNTLAQSFTDLLSGMQAKVTAPSPTGIAAALRSIDVEVKGFVNVQDQAPQVVVPQPGEALDANMLSSVRMAFVTVPAPVPPQTTETTPTTVGPQAEDGAASATPVSAVVGIGRTFTQRLNQAGVATVEQLLALSADDLARIMRTSPGRAESIQELARKHVLDRMQR
jgi:predicted flap endonuclease-1-like 5' DNA nuclease